MAKVYNLYNHNVDPIGIAPCLDTMGGGNREPKIIQPVLTPDRHGIAIREATRESMPIKLGNIYKSGGQNGNVYDIEGVSPTISSGTTNTKGNGGIGSNNAPKIVEPTLFRIRKLTPLECWRLQGFTDEQFYKAKNDGVSNSQLYKQAGNSVTVNVIDAIARKLV